MTEFVSDVPTDRLIARLDAVDRLRLLRQLVAARVGERTIVEHSHRRDAADTTSHSGMLVGVAYAPSAPCPDVLVLSTGTHGLVALSASQLVRVTDVDGRVIAGAPR